MLSLLVQGLSEQGEGAPGPRRRGCIAGGHVGTAGTTWLGGWGGVGPVGGGSSFWGAEEKGGGGEGGRELCWYYRENDQFDADDSE